MLQCGRPSSAMGSFGAIAFKVRNVQRQRFVVSRPHFRVLARSQQQFSFDQIAKPAQYSFSVYFLSRRFTLSKERVVFHDLSRLSDSPSTNEELLVESKIVEAR